MKLNYFKEKKFLPAIKALLDMLNIPVNYISDEPTTAQEILEYNYKDNMAKTEQPMPPKTEQPMPKQECRPVI